MKSTLLLKQLMKMFVKTTNPILLKVKFGGCLAIHLLINVITYLKILKKKVKNEIH